MCCLLLFVVCGVLFVFCLLFVSLLFFLFCLFVPCGMGGGVGGGLAPAAFSAVAPSGMGGGLGGDREQCIIRFLPGTHT